MQAPSAPELQAVFAHPPELQDVPCLIDKLEETLAAQRLCTTQDLSISISAQLAHLASSAQGQKG